MFDGSAVLDLDEISAEDRSGWSASARSARLLELLEAFERLRAELLRCVGEWDADLAWTLDGSRSPAAWLTRHARLTTAEARDLVRAGRLVQANERTAKALSSGDISSAHVSIAARAARHVEDLYAEHEDVLVDAATTMSPDDYRTAVACWRSYADDVADRKPDRGFERRHLHLSEVLDGMGRLDGYLDAETLQRLAAVLDRIEPPDPIDGETTPRPLATRRADALARLVGGDRAPRVTVFALVDHDTLHGRMPSDLADARCEVMGSCGGPIGLDALELLLCDCSISRVVMRGKREVLDLGRSTPVVSEAQRRALAVRDGGCTEPGCTIPAEWCDAHHEEPWSEGGPTDLDNLQLKCRRHHVQVHRERRRRGRPGCPSP